MLRRALLLLAYPPLAHLAVISKSRSLTFAALALLIVVLCYAPLQQGRHGAWPVLLGALAIAASLAAAGDGLWLMVALSLGLPALVLAGFARSLRAGATPLITGIAARLHQPLPAELRRYTRALTQLWCGVIAVLMAVEVALITLATPTDWSRYANGYAYALLGGVFAVEYAYRRWRFRTLPQPRLSTYLRALLGGDAPLQPR